MRHTIITICLALLSLTARGQAAPAATGQGAQGNAPGKSPDITFAWLSDVHLNSFAYAEDDLRQAIEDINAMPGVQFVILSGDLTEFGDTEEFRFMRDILQNFNKPYLLVTGNHDVNWSENGCTAFVDFLGAPHFCYDCQGVRFIGCGAGPALRMGPPQIPREEVVWLDSVVANAGIHRCNTMLDISEEELDLMIDTNIKGTVHTLRAAVPCLLERGGSVVINASDQCYVGKPNSFGYGLTKGALGQITKSLAIDLGPKGVRVNAVCAGTIRTPLTEKLFQSFADITHGGDASAYWRTEAGLYPLGLAIATFMSHLEQPMMREFATLFPSPI